jgi:hypothetical protein
LNIHGIFTKIVDKTDDYILVKYMHTSAKGIDIYDPGSRIQVLNQKNLIPAGEYEIERVEVVNMEYTKLYIKGGTADIPVGYVVEDLTWVSDLLFENNRVDKVVFGHIHGAAYFPLKTEFNGVEYILSSCDKLAFKLVKIY